MTPSHSRKAKAKTKKKEEGLKPTRAWWERESYIKRRTGWLWRLRPYILEKNKEQCGSCQMNGRCHRVPLDEKITGKILEGQGCPDHRSVWKKILGKDEPYDWGF